MSFSYKVRIHTRNKTKPKENIGVQNLRQKLAVGLNLRRSVSSHNQ